MQVSLTPELEQFIHAQVEGGLYHSASEVICEGIQMLLERDAMKKQRIEMLNAEIDKGMTSLEAGRVMTGEEAIALLRDRRTQYTAQ